MKQVIGYTRVSTEEQGDSRLGLEAQREAIDKYTSQHSYTLAGLSEEVASAKGHTLDRRPVLRVVLE